MAGELEIGEDLRRVDGEDRLNRLEFNDDATGHHKVEPKRGVQPDRVVDHREMDLLRERGFRGFSIREPGRPRTRIRETRGRANDAP